MKQNKASGIISYFQPTLQRILGHLKGDHTTGTSLTRIGFTLTVTKEGNNSKRQL